MNVLETVSKRINEVPMLSVVASRLLAISGEDNHSLKDVVKIVENDPYLTARVLRVANSAAFSPGYPMTTLGRAIIHLGEKIVAGIAVGSCSSRIFNLPLQGYESGAGDLWNHSLQTAIAAREISQFARTGVSSDLAFTAGLLHDIGKAIISEFLVGNTETLTKWCDERKTNDFLAAEDTLIGTNHAAVGYELAMHWKLPASLAEAIKFHHKPADSDDKHKGLIFVTHVADLVSMMGGSGTGADVLAYKIDDGYERYLTFGRDDLARVLLTVQIEFSKTKKFIAGDEEAWA